MMKDTDCVRFLQWALPRMGMRWPGFRKVRRGVCKRVARRIKSLYLSDVEAYRSYLDSHPEEWATLDALSRVSISRFYRDKRVFKQLEELVLPPIAESALMHGETELRCWSCGCASGEEPYTISLIWNLCLQARFPSLALRVIATDSDPRLLARAHTACYPPSSVKELPKDWLDAAFDRTGNRYRLRRAYKGNVEFQQLDIREEGPEATFHLILCRNLAFTYFQEGLQKQTLEKIRNRLLPNGFFVIGAHERLPDDAETPDSQFKDAKIFQR